MEWWALKTLHPEFLLIIFLFVVLLIMLWGGGARCLFFFYLFFFILKCSSTALNLLSPKVHYSDIQLLNDKCTDRQTEGGWWRWEVTTVAAECHFERVDLRCVWEGWGWGILKTNTGSAASSSSNQSSVTGNAGLGVCAWLKNCPSFKLSLPLGSVLNLHRAFCFVLFNLIFYFSDTWEVVTMGVNKGDTCPFKGFSLKRWYVPNRPPFLCHLKWLLFVFMHYFFSAPPLIDSPSLALLKTRGNGVSFSCLTGCHLSF